MFASKKTTATNLTKLKTKTRVEGRRTCIVASTGVLT